MKIEIGESLMYSWLRHVKGCQIVQNNWKVSPKWNLSNETELRTFADVVKKQLGNRYNIFGKNTFEQFLAQGEADAIGINLNNNEYYAIEVAYHLQGLNYNGKNNTIAKVIEKCLRTAMCFYGYLGVDKAEIIFVSPKIGDKLLSELTPALNTLQNISDNLDLKFKYIIYCNDDFVNGIVTPIRLCGDDVNDTSELFLRSIQLINLSDKIGSKTKNSKSSSVVPSSQQIAYSQFKIGQLANQVLRNKLEAGNFTKQEISEFLDADFSKKTFGLQYPLLVEDRNTTNKKHYYQSPLTISKKQYYLCIEWHEQGNNNDRPLLEDWLSKH